MPANKRRNEVACMLSYVVTKRKLDQTGREIATN